MSSGEVATVALPSLLPSLRSCRRCGGRRVPGRGGRGGRREGGRGGGGAVGVVLFEVVVLEGLAPNMGAELDCTVEDGVAFQAEEREGAGGAEHHRRLLLAVGAHAKRKRRRRKEGGREGGKRMRLNV